MHENALGTKVLDAAFSVHKALGPGLLESAYERCMAYELLQTGLNVQTQVGLPLVYKGVQLDCGYRLDLWIERKVIVEVKAVEALTDIHVAQVLTYLKLTNVHLAYLINFNVKLLRDGIRRLVL
ncbi:GxxExxY protein [Paracnuella aquatica]|uniref:GxxExxY protein n=1 Tax=Paracnuella aquatica TaxID=2268757 RepID=UPI000DEFDA4E|nr:GxxExxY protein [Paracnuella aquatica]RPD45516.1 GxxExxY protein [Paracnuella aquatica]